MKKAVDWIVRTLPRKLTLRISEQINQQLVQERWRSLEASNPEQMNKIPLLIPLWFIQKFCSARVLFKVKSVTQKSHHSSDNEWGKLKQMETPTWIIDQAYNIIFLTRDTGRKWGNHSKIQEKRYLLHLAKNLKKKKSKSHLWKMTKREREGEKMTTSVRLWKALFEAW